MRADDEQVDPSDGSDRSDASDGSQPAARLLPPHGGYRKLRGFQAAQLVYDGTVMFCNRFIAKTSRTHDQMVQAARSGVRNIAEGSVASGTSKKGELKLTNVARASLEELMLDYQDFLRQRGLRVWEKDSPKLWRSDVNTSRTSRTNPTPRTPTLYARRHQRLLLTL